MIRPATDAGGPESPAARCEHIAAVLEEDIVLGVLYPRQRLVEDELMARFDAKRHVVRDALARLEQMGLVERRRNVGAMVRAFDEQEVRELYDMRILLECEAMRRMPLPPSTQDLEALHRIQQRHDAAVDADDQRGVFRSNQAFHEALYAMCGNGVLATAIQEYARRTHAIRFGALSSPDQQARSRQDHHAILQALEHGDREALIGLAHSHLLPSRDRYLALMRARSGGKSAT